jgi:hypothetical protein
MVTALGLYCDLLEEPGVLATPFHYGNELRLVAAASRRLVEKLLALDSRERRGRSENRLGSRAGSGNRPGIGAAAWQGTRSGRPPDWTRPALGSDARPKPIDNLAAELLANRNLLAALAGPSIALTVDAEGGALAGAADRRGSDPDSGQPGQERRRGHARQTGASPSPARVSRPERQESGSWLMLTVEDNGPGIPRQVRWRRSSTPASRPRSTAWPDQAGQPLIAAWASPSPAPSSRAAGGGIHAANRARAEPESRSNCPHARRR